MEVVPRYDTKRIHGQICLVHLHDVYNDVSSWTPEMRIDGGCDENGHSDWLRDLL